MGSNRWSHRSGRSRSLALTVCLAAATLLAAVAATPAAADPPVAGRWIYSMERGGWRFEPAEGTPEGDAYGSRVYSPNRGVEWQGGPGPGQQLERFGTAPAVPNRVVPTIPPAVVPAPPAIKICPGGC